MIKLEKKEIMAKASFKQGQPWLSDIDKGQRGGSGLPLARASGFWNTCLPATTDLLVPQLWVLRNVDPNGAERGQDGEPEVQVWSWRRPLWASVSPPAEALGENGKVALSVLVILTFPFLTFPRRQACVSAASAGGDTAAISSPQQRPGLTPGRRARSAAGTSSKALSPSGPGPSPCQLTAASVPTCPALPDTLSQASSLPAPPLAAFPALLKTRAPPADSQGART